MSAQIKYPNIFKYNRIQRDSKLAPISWKLRNLFKIYDKTTALTTFKQAKSHLIILILCLLKVDVTVELAIEEKRRYV